MLNHKENIRNEIRYKRFISNPSKWSTDTGESNLQGHIDRINKYGFVPFLIASACFLLLHIIGGIVARKFARNANLAVAKERDSLDLKLCKLRADLADLEHKKTGLLEEIR